MLDMRYIRDEGRYLDQAWEVYRDYFASKPHLLEQYHKIPTVERKNLFLRIVSCYKLLVRDGAYRLVRQDQHLYLDYLDCTYKFISIMSLIEALFSEDEYVDFYQWMTMRKRKKLVFPIVNAEALEDLYREYKLTYGAKRAIRFFSELDESAQHFLASRLKIGDLLKSAEVVAHKLYIIRSEFVHQARLILEFNDGSMFSKREGDVLYSTLSLKDLQLLFEHGILQQFCMTPDFRKI